MFRVRIGSGVGKHEGRFLKASEALESPIIFGPNRDTNDLAHFWASDYPAIFVTKGMTSLS